MARDNSAPQNRSAIRQTSEFQLRNMAELPMEEFGNILKECGHESEITNEDVLEDYFTHVETTHISNFLPSVPEQKEGEKRPTLVIMAGPNGAGKTTIMTRLAKHGWLRGMVYQNQDFIAQNLFGGWNNEEAIKKSEKYCHEEREACLAERKDIAFETVSGVSKLDFIKRAKAAGYYIIYMFVCTYSPTLHASRVAIRVMKGGHSIPIPLIISRYMESLLNSRALCHMADRAYVFDNSAHNADARLILEFKNGELLTPLPTDTDEILPRWALTILE